jgi:hypothetical protein
VYAPPVLTERRSTGAMVGGIVGVSLGAVLLLSAAIEATVGDSCLYSGDSCGNNTGTVIGLTVAGLIGIGVGIPLIVYGAKRVPVGTALAPGKAFALASPLPQWAGAPGGTGWKWQF